MHHSKILGRTICDTPDECLALCWLYGAEPNEQARAAMRLGRLDSQRLGQLLAEVAVGARGNWSCPPVIPDAISDTFGSATRAAFDIFFEKVRSWHSVKLLLMEVSQEGFMEACGRLFAEQRFDECYEQISAIPDLDSRLIAEFLTKVGQNGGSPNAASRWLACRLARR